MIDLDGYQKKQIYIQMNEYKSKYETLLLKCQAEYQYTDQALLVENQHLVLQVDRLKRNVLKLELNLSTVEEIITVEQPVAEIQRDSRARGEESDFEVIAASRLSEILELKAKKDFRIEYAENEFTELNIKLDETNKVREIYASALLEIKSLKGNRIEFKAMLAKQESAKRKILEEELLKINQESTRLRNQRDLLQIKSEVISKIGNDELLKLLESRNIRIEQLEMQSQRAENPNRLEGELDILGRAWSLLDEQNSSKVLCVIEKEEQYSKIFQEKLKLEQKLLFLSKQVSALQNIQLASKRQSEKQLDLVRKLEDISSNLTSQVQTQERQIAEIYPELEFNSQKLGHGQLKIEQQADEIIRLETANNYLQVQLDLKGGEINSVEEGSRYSKEQVIVLKKRIESMVKGDASLQQTDQYRLLLMCQSCNNNFKSHVLSKCMHTFCKECIDDMYNSRQRKCPTCAIPFGLPDVKQVYL